MIRPLGVVTTQSVAAAPFAPPARDAAKRGANGAHREDLPIILAAEKNILVFNTGYVVGAGFELKLTVSDQNCLVCPGNTPVSNVERQKGAHRGSRRPWGSRLGIQSKFRIFITGPLPLWGPSAAYSPLLANLGCRLWITSHQSDAGPTTWFTILLPQSPSTGTCEIKVGD